MPLGFYRVPCCLRNIFEHLGIDAMHSGPFPYIKYVCIDDHIANQYDQFTALKN